LVKSAGAVHEPTPLEREFLPPLLEIQETPPSPVLRWTLWTLIALVIALIAWASIGSVSVVATAPGKFVPDGRVKEVQPLEASMVKAIHVTEGQRVRAGDLLLELDPALSAAELQADSDKYGFNQLEQARLAAELRESRSSQSFKSSQPAERVALEERIRRAPPAGSCYDACHGPRCCRGEEGSSRRRDSDPQKYRETTGIAAERESSARPLVESGAISRTDYLQLKQDLAQNSNDLAAQEKTVRQAEAAVNEAEHSVEQIQRDRVADIYNDLDQRVSSEPTLKGDLDKSRQLYQLKWLRAPVSGQVQKVDVTTIGQVVTPAQSLVTIVPDGTPLVVEATVTNEDIGYLRVGQPVDIKVDTFPFQKYGSLKGTLIWVSPDAEDKTAASKDADTRSGTAASRDHLQAPDNPNAGYVYKVRIRPAGWQLLVNGQSRSVQSGMTVQADIITDRRRVIDFFLSPVTKYLDEALEVR
jgi:hemolysin D